MVQSRHHPYTFHFQKTFLQHYHPTCGVNHCSRRRLPIMFGMFYVSMLIGLILFYSGLSTRSFSRYDYHTRYMRFFLSDFTTTTFLDGGIKHRYNEYNDTDCPFRNSSIYRKIYVYPAPGEYDPWEGEVLSETGRRWNADGTSSSFQMWPWVEYDAVARKQASGHYNMSGNNVQYTTELLIRELMTNPRSCLRTYNPEDAELFYVPYLPSMEHHMGDDQLKPDYSQSPYGKAILNILNKHDYTDWENIFGLTSKYWKRRKGSDHVLTFSEPLHGLSHPRSRRGNYHYVHTQKQLRSPIVISVELSTTFVEMYPACSAKNILLPYPNIVGSWFNGGENKRALDAIMMTQGGDMITANTSGTAIPGERELYSKRMEDGMFESTTSSSLMSLGNIPRPMGQYFNVGLHGTCKRLRVAMKGDYKKCSKSSDLVDRLKLPHSTGLRLATFCPCPGGDSPSAKRMFDAILAGCIPIVLSHDFVWPFSTEFDRRVAHPTDDVDDHENIVSLLNPNDFSIRLEAHHYDKSLLDDTTCQPLNDTKPGLQAYLDSVSTDEIVRLRTNGQRIAMSHYSWYAPREDLPDNPLRDGILPDGGLAHMVVKSLEERTKGRRWPACQAELSSLARSQQIIPEPTEFKC